MVAWRPPTSEPGATPPRRRPGLAGETTVKLGPVTLRCRGSGGDRLPVLLPHGFGGALELWNRPFDAPLPGLRLLAWDMPGHGLSSAAPGDTDLAAIARLV